MRVPFALALAVALRAAAPAAEVEVYQVAGQLAVVETDAHLDDAGEERVAATRFMMVLEPDRTLDYQRAAGSEFKPLYDEIVASSRRNVRPGYRDATGKRLALTGAAPGSLGALVAATAPGGEKLVFFGFTGKLALRQDHEHPWAQKWSHFVVGELCLESAAHGEARWRAAEDACAFLLPD